MIEGANGHTFHYDYTLYDYMWEIKLELEAVAPSNFATRLF